MSKKVLIIVKKVSKPDSTGQIYFFLQKKQEILFSQHFFQLKSESHKIV